MSIDTTQSGKTTKGEQTRTRILDCALSLFREHGYEGTTMRAVAEAAGVSLGNAYYYFKSKEHLIQAFYDRTHAEHLKASEPLLVSETRFRERLLGVMSAKLHVNQPYHRFAGVLFKTAADPKSPLNPFSEASRSVREESIALFARVFKESDAKAPKKLAAELPELLWTYHMGIILYWIYDDSPGAGRTKRLTNSTVDLVVNLIKLSRLPPLRPVVTRLLRLLGELRGGAPVAGDRKVLPNGEDG